MINLMSKAEYFLRTILSRSQKIVFLAKRDVKFASNNKLLFIMVIFCNPDKYIDLKLSESQNSIFMLEILVNSLHYTKI